MSEQRGIITRVATGLRYIVSGAAPADWFGPAAPLPPMAPPEVAGRGFDFPVGVNLRIAPRPDESVSFAELRALADGYDLLRLVLETRKDQVGRFDWTIRRRGGGKTAAEDPRIAAVAALLRYPDAEDPASAAEIADTHVRAGIKSVDEVRRELGLAPVGKGTAEVAKYSPDQPRVPAGRPGGGQWTNESDAGGATTQGPGGKSPFVTDTEFFFFGRVPPVIAPEEIPRVAPEAPRIPEAPRFKEPIPRFSGKEFARRLTGEKYGKGKWEDTEGGQREYN
jgi:hypothetical protein